MKKVVFLAVFAAMLLSPEVARAYDFSAAAPSGQTLYYNIIGGSAQVTRPSNNDWTGYVKPSGALIIPDEVTNDATGITYTVTEIDTMTFFECGDLTSVTMGESMIIIWNWAFCNCGLSSVTIGNSVTIIGEYAFSECRNLTSVTIPNSVIVIGVGAFCYCNNLTSVTIGTSVTSIGSEAFANCNRLISVSIPSTVETIGNNAFYRVKTIVYSGSATGAPWGAYTDNGVIAGDFVYADSAQTILLTYIGTSPDVTIPGTVVVIGPYAFYQNMDSFYGNTNITSVTIPNSVQEIGNHAFDGCGHLTTVSLPRSLTRIGNYAFSYCWALASLTIGDQVTSIGEYAFEECNRMTTITIGRAVDSIGNNAFLGCRTLSSVEYTGTIAGWCGINFYSSYSNPVAHAHVLSINRFYVSNLIVPAEVTEIKPYAFYECDCITSLTIAGSVTRIGNSAFYGCGGITNIHMQGATPPTVDSYNNLAMADVYVPCGAVPAYQASGYWSQYSLFEEFSYAVYVFANNSTQGIVQMTGTPTCYNPQVNIQAVPRQGFHFVQWSDGETVDTRTVTITSDTTFIAYFEPNGGTEGVADVQTEGCQITLQPNPAATMVRVVSDVGLTWVEAYYIVGAKVADQVVAGNETTLNVSSWPVGTYLLRLTTPVGSVTKKLIVQRR